MMNRDKIYQPEEVKTYYEEWTDRYMEVAGNNFQAYRTTKEDEMFEYFIRTIGIEKNHSLLDAGCGVGGTIMPFARKVAGNFTGISISPYQISLANKFLAENKSKLKGNVNFVEGDYHKLSTIFPEESFNHVIFLGASGHTNDPKKLIGEVFKVLKKGGNLYIKDTFRKLSYDPAIQAKIDETINIHNKHFCYNTLELSETLDIIRATGFDLEFLRPVQYNGDPTVKKEFARRNNLTGMGYGAVNLYELKCVKP